MDFSSATMGLSRHEKKKQAKTLCKEVLTKHKVGTFSRPHHSPKPASWQAASHQQSKKSHLAVLILAALCPTGRLVA